MLLNLLSCLWRNGKSLHICWYEDDTVVPWAAHQDSSMALKLKGGGGRWRGELHHWLVNEQMAHNSHCSLVNHSWVDRAVGSCCDQVASAPVALTVWGCHYTVFFCTSMVLLSVVWHRPDVWMEGLEKCVCLRGYDYKEFPYLISMFVPASVTEDVSWGTRENTAFTHI